MIININTAKRFTDLPLDKSNNLIDTSRSPVEVREEIERLVAIGKDFEINTLNYVAVNVIGYLMDKEIITEDSAQINIYKDCIAVKTCYYENVSGIGKGFIKHWEIGFYSWDN